MTAPIGGRVTYRVVDTDGATVADVEDSRAGRLSQFSWVRGGSTVAYPGDGVSVVSDLPHWGQRRIDTSSIGEIEFSAWGLDGNALLVDGFQGALLIDTGSGDVLRDDFRGFLAAVTPDGRQAIFVTGDGTGSADVVDLETASVSAISDIGISDEGGLGPAFTFAGDSSRLCWVVRIPPPTSAACARLDGSGRSEVRAPLQIDRDDYVGSGDVERLFAALAPDLTKVAYTLPGPADPTAPQTLWTADLDGSNRVEVGSALGLFSFEWRPDGVYRQPSRH